MPSFPKRTHTCGELRRSHTGTAATLTGWVDVRRDLGGLIFVDLRDRYGKTQVTFDPNTAPEAHALAKELRSEFVIAVTGLVGARPDPNPAMATGEIDLRATALVILNRAETPPIGVGEESDASEDLRLRYRYLDLRRPSLQKNFLLRHRMYQLTRRFFDEKEFIEVETPMLMRSTPEGARDYLVPSRVHPGRFYALPQSPQTYKQILMVAGMDRYFQIVKCFRDEDLRADRQPEFTQIDVEMSFVEEDDVLAVAEELMRRLFREIKGIDLVLPLPRMTYAEAMQTYGSDKPDTRFGLRFSTVTPLVAGCGFKVFADVAAAGGVVAGFAIPGAASFSRSQIDGLVEYARSQGAGGLAYAKWTEKGIESPIEKFIGRPLLEQIALAMKAAQGDLMVFVSGPVSVTYPVLGALRLEVARRLTLIDENRFELLWVTAFPLLEYSPEEKRFVAVHHPFTSPHPEDIHFLTTDPLQARARAYDLVLNGNEIAGGSIRIHDTALQQQMFALLGIDAGEAKKRFGFLLDAFRYGAPPHGGIAFGFDRMVMLLAGLKSIREVIAFPKTASATSLMDDAPGEVDEKQLQELHIRLAKEGRDSR